MVGYGVINYSLTANHRKTAIYHTTTFDKKGCRKLSLQQPFLTYALLLHSVDGALAAILALALELDGTVNQSKQGVIAADAHVDAGMNVSASLANQNVASQNKLTVCTLDAQALSLGVTAVLVEPPPLW